MQLISDAIKEPSRQSEWSRNGEMDVNRSDFVEWRGTK